MTFTDRRPQLVPSPVPAHRCCLTSTTSRTDEPLIARATTFRRARPRATVDFASLFFSDGVFFRRHRSESTISYVDGTPATVSALEWTTWGAYESRPGSVVLLHYSPPSSSVPARDSLAIALDTLVRRTPQ